MIGSGIFALPASLAPFGWTGVVAWAIAIPSAMMLAYVVAKLAAARPDATGMVGIIGEATGTLPGVLVGWSYWIGIWTANAIIAVTAIRYLSTFIPVLTTTPMVTAIAAIGLNLIILLINLRGAKAAGRFQVVTTLLKLVPLVAVVAIVAALLASGGERFTAEPEPAFQASGLTSAVALAFFAMLGFESAGTAAERVRDPARNVLRATLIGAGFTGALYFVVCSGVIFALPQSQVSASSAPIALFVETFWGRGAGLALAAFAVIATVGCLNGWVFIQGEIPLGMARVGLLPRWMGQTSARGVPAVMLLVGTACSAMLILTTATGTFGGILDFMLNLGVASALWAYIGACAAALRLGVARAAAIIGLIFCVWAMIGTGLAGVWSIALMLTALPLYWWARRSRPMNETSAMTS